LNEHEDDKERGPESEVLYVKERVREREMLFSLN